MSNRAAALVAGLAAAAWIVTRDLAPLVLPTAYLGYQPSGPSLAQLIEPVLHAPWIGTVSWLFAALLAVCLVSEAWLLSVMYGASSAATAVALLALVLSDPWTAAVRHGSSLTMAVAFSWLMWMFVVRDRAASPAKGLLPIALGIASWIAAIACSWLALIGTPMLLAGLTTSEHRKRIRAALVVLGVMACVAGLALYCLRIADLTASLTAAASSLPSMVDVAAVLVDPARRAPIGWQAGPTIETVIVTVLGALGIVGATTRRRWRGSVLGSAVVAAAVAMVWPAWMATVLALVVWLVTPFVAVGLTLLMRVIAARREAMATSAAGLALVAFGMGDWFTSHASRDPGSNAPANWLLLTLAREPSASFVVNGHHGAAFVAEDAEIDAPVIAALGAGDHPWRVAQDPAAVTELHDRGMLVLTGPLARRRLELAGFRFEQMIAIRAAGTFNVSSVVGQLHCATVRSDRWSLLPGLEYTGRLGIEVPAGAGGRMTLIVGDDSEMPRLIVSNARGEEQRVRVEPLLTAPSVEAPPPDYWFDGGDPVRAPGHVFRVRLPAHPAAASLLDVALGRRAPRVLARLEGFDDGSRGRVCAAPLAAPDPWTQVEGPHETREVIVPLNATAMLTSGWYGLVGEGTDGTHRWTDRVAVVLVPSERRTATRVAIDAEPAARDGEPPTLGLVVNGLEQPAHVMHAASNRYEWQVPVATWLTGTNELMFTVSRLGRDPREPGIKVTRLALTRE